MVEILHNQEIVTLEQLVSKSDKDLRSIKKIGPQTLKRIRSTVNQAIWM